MLSSFLREREEKTETRPSCFEAFFYSERERDKRFACCQIRKRENMLLYVSVVRERERERRKKSRGDLIAKLEVFFLEKESKIDFPIFS